MSENLPLPKQAHQILKQYLNNGDVAIDATCGNGFDTVFLAQQVAPNGLVYAFDIQQQAIEATQKRLQKTELENKVKLIQEGHENLSRHIATEHQGKIKAVMFNLGYLPRADKQIITKTETTLTALEAALSLLAPLGMITILAYPGHQGGDSETLVVEAKCLELSKTDYQFQIIESPIVKATAPRLFVLQRKT